MDRPSPAVQDYLKAVYQLGESSDAGGPITTSQVAEALAVTTASASNMLKKLDAEVAAWNRLDPKTPVQPALHVIVLVADGHPGSSGKYRTRHDSAMIEKVYGWAKSRNAIMFVDLRVGLELPLVSRRLHQRESPEPGGRRPWLAAAPRASGLQLRLVEWKRHGVETILSAIPFHVARSPAAGSRWCPRR